MRVGQNPAKNIKTVIKPQRITVAVLNYIPNQQGYFAESFAVLQRCLGSILDNTRVPYDLMLFDNGSCQEVKQYLQELEDNGKIQYLVFSGKNVGKGGAWDFIFNAAPGEIIAYSDNDAYFYSGWLEESLKVLETYPKVGMVTARPMKTIATLSSSTIQWAIDNKNQVTMKTGDIISYEDFVDFASTLNYSEELLIREFNARKDYLLTYKDVNAFVGANHFQFIGWKKNLQKCLPFDMQKPLGQVKQLDERLNTMGYLRLMIDKPLIQNMSNRILEPNEKAKTIITKRRFQIKNLSIIRKTLLWIHDRIFTLYYDK